ncbi:autotransporter-associated beta strand repeat-containing protein, partial [Flavobacterium sp.]|uniref:autotransporter-associated beta strand repeat-containing protein n=1 Tax=Flavobacterium sp. TaxID=239 RepID=UPI002FD99446
MKKTLLLFVLLLSVVGYSQTQFFWRGDSGLDGNWNASNRWWIGSPSAAGFGQLNFDNNAYLTATCNGSFDTWRIFVASSANSTRTTTGTGTVTFYDFSGQVPLIRNNSTALHVFDQNFSVGNTSGATRFDRRLEIIASAGDLNFGGTFSTANVNNVTRSLRLDVANSRTLTLSGTITQVNSSNALLVQKIGAGTANLSGSNSFTLGVVMDEGILRAGSNTAFGSGVFEFYGGVLSSTSATARTFSNGFLIGGSVTFGQSSGGTGDLTLTGGVNLNEGTRTITVVNGTTTFSGAVSNGGLTKAGSGTLVLSGTQTYTGPTSVSAGQLVIEKSGYTATLSSSGLQVQFSSPPAVGTYVIVPGALSSGSALTTSGLGVGKTATFNATTGLLTVNETPAVSLESSAGVAPYCAGTSVTFTATASSTGGGTVTYIFTVDGNPVQTGTSATYTTSALTNGQVVQVSISITGGFVSPSTATSSVLTQEVVTPVLWYLDADLDGYSTGTPVLSCDSPGVSYVLTVIGGNDCDDTDATKHATFDFYADLDGDTYGAGAPVALCAVNASTPPAGYSVNATDCDDTDATKHATFAFYADLDGDTYGAGAPVAL